MSDEWLHQASFKTAKGTLVNVRAGSAQELIQALQQYEAGVLPTSIANVEAALTATAAVTQAVGQVQHVAPAAPIDQWTNQPTQAGPRIPPCPHGTRKLIHGNSSKGPWSGFMCAAPKDAPGKCDPVFKSRDNATQWDW